MFYIDYTDTTIVISSSADSLVDDISENFSRIVLNEQADLAAFDNPMLVRLYNEGAPKQIKAIIDRDDAMTVIWARLTGQPAPEKDLNVPNNDKKNEAARARRAAKKDTRQPLQSDSTQVTSDSPEGNLPAETQKKGKKMAKKKAVKKVAAKKKAVKKVAAKKKKAAKKATKPTNGLPREGTKNAKLLALILRDGGATFKEMFKATGWKEMRGTASVLAVRAGKKLTIIKTEGKESRWAAK